MARRAFRPLRRVALRSGPRAGILMYHRIAREAVDPWNLCVSPAAFDEQMAVLARRRASVDLAAFADGGACDRAGRRIAVTFDDAYSDNLAAALPILEKYDVPATLFVVSRALGQGEYWWDGLMRALLESGPLPPVLRLTLGREEREFRLADSAGTSRWDADHEEPRTGRERLYLGLWNAMIVLDPQEQEDATAQVLAWAGLPQEGPEQRRPAPAEAIAALTNHPLVRIGSHTRHHVSLPHLAPERQLAEIEGGQRELEALIGRPIDRFSYPFGRHDASARAHVRALGIPVACTSHPDLARPGTPRDELPRLHVTECDGDGFARWLHDDFALLTGR